MRLFDDQVAPDFVMIYHWGEHVKVKRIQSHWYSDRWVCECCGSDFTDRIVW